MKIHSLHFYPVKSCGAVTVDKLACDARGPFYDREWMVVDAASGKFVTQRELPRMQLIRPRVDAGRLVLTAPDAAELALPLERAATMGHREVEVWGQPVRAEDEGEGAARWFSAVLGRELALVRLGAGERLTGSGELTRSVRFPDSAPLHLCSLSSLADLNSRLAAPVEIGRFRPNIVIEGAAPFAEDEWQGIEVEGLRLPIFKACSRCTITTVDPETTSRGPEPLKTLATYRKRGTKIEFGQYLLSFDRVELRTGMEVQCY